jgi:hypothetical protein
MISSYDQARVTEEDMILRRSRILSLQWIVLLTIPSISAMTLMDSQPLDPSSDTTFRPSKRRKVYRQREAEETHNVSLETPTSSHLQQIEVDLTEASPAEIETSITNILKLRKNAKARRGGIEFSNRLRAKQNPSGTSNELESRAETPEDIATIVNRFAPQTGQVADVDQHM